MSDMNGEVKFAGPEEAALDYHQRRKWKLVPVVAGTKRPCNEGWQNTTVAEGDLLAHCRAGGSIGVQTGLCSRLLDVDLDTREAVLAAPHVLPGTGLISGRPGAERSHWWYGTLARHGHMEFLDLPPGKGEKVQKLLELRGEGHQTVVPPSRHPAGGCYAWACYGEPAQVDIAMLVQRVKELAVVALLARHWPGADSRSRHSAFLPLAGALAHGGYDPLGAERIFRGLIAATEDEEGADRLRVLADTYHNSEDDRHVTGWPTLAQHVGGPAVKKAQEWLGLGSSPRAPQGPPPEWTEPVPLTAIPEVAPFPLNAFPEPVAAFVRETAEALSCPIDYVAVPSLGAASVALGASRALAVKPGHVQRAALYEAVVGPPGSGKTPAQEAALEPLHEAEEQLHAAWEAEMQQHEAEAQGYEQELRDWKKAPAGERGELPRKPDRPVLKRLTVNDTTAEALVPILKDNPRGVVMARDELVAWVGSMNQYREGGKGADQQFWLSAWSGSTVTVDRKKTHEQGPLRVPRPFISVVGGLVPDKLPALRGDRARGRAEQDGFLDRVLLSYPAEPAACEETWKAVPDATREGWRAVLKKLRSLEMVPVQEGDRVTGWRPHLVKLGASGRQAWQDFTRRHAAEVNAPDFPPHLRGPWSKLRGYCARLALIVHYLRWAAGEVERDADVDKESITRAACLVAYFKSHARKVYALIDADPRTAAARRLLSWVAREDKRQFTRRDAFRALRGPMCKTADDIDPILTLLEKHGYIRPLPAPDDGRPGRKPSPAFEAHPGLFAGSPAAAESGHCGHSAQIQEEFDEDQVWEGEVS
jgi:hypothetical protein